MTAGEIVSELVRINAALGAGVLAAAILRLPARRLIGARLAYGLWLLPLVAAVAVTIPPGKSVVLVKPAPPPIAASADQAAMAIAQTPPAAKSAAPTPALPALPSTPGLLVAAWLAGAAGFAGWLGWRQARFLRLAREGLAGPAAVGLLNPRVVLPADFETRFSAAERQAVLAHEQAHLAAQHPRLNALIAAAQTLCWFNPLVHLGAHLARLDQELACDAAVVERAPDLRRLYAQTLLKTQLNATPLPLGCFWPPKSEHPLTQRVEMLSRASPSRRRRVYGLAAVTLTAAVAGLGAWAAQPPAVTVRTAPDAPALNPATVSISSDRMEVSPTGQATYSGNVVIEAAGAAFRTDQLTTAAPTPKAYTLTPDVSRYVRLAGEIERIDWDGPRAIVHLRDEATGRRWAVETGTPNTLLRAGLTKDGAKGRVDIVAFPAQADACKPECRALVRRMTFADGRAVFLGAAGPALPPTNSDKDAALARGDWRLAAGLGATAAEIVSALQAKGQAKDIVPNEAVVVIPPDGGEPQVTAMKPLPPLDGAPRGDRAPLNGTGFGFGARPGSIILYPPGTRTFSDRALPPPPPAGGDGEAARNLAEGRLTAAESAYAEAKAQFDFGLIPLADLDQAALRVLAADKAQADLSGRPRWTAQPRAVNARTPIIRRVSDPAGPRPAQGWRPFAAVYDGAAPVLLKGKVRSVEWTAPRVLVHMTDAASGKTWAVEGGSPEAMAASGFGRDQFAAGEDIVVRGYQSKGKVCEPECLASGRDVTFADGTKRTVGTR